LTLEADDKVTFVHERDDVEVGYEEGLQLGEALSRLKKHDPCATYVFWQLDTGIKEKEDFRALHSKTRARAGGYLYLTNAAPEKPRVRYVRTSAGFTPKWQASLPFSGVLILRSFPESLDFGSRPAKRATTAITTSMG
jgi:hypothetical protein